MIRDIKSAAACGSICLSGICSFEILQIGTDDIDRKLPYFFKRHVMFMAVPLHAES